VAHYQALTKNYIGSLLKLKVNFIDPPTLD